MPLLIFSFAGTDQASGSNSSSNAATSTFFNPPDRLSHHETILGTCHGQPEIITRSIFVIRPLDALCCQASHLVDNFSYCRRMRNEKGRKRVPSGPNTSIVTSSEP